MKPKWPIENYMSKPDNFVRTPRHLLIPRGLTGRRLCGSPPPVGTLR